MTAAGNDTDALREAFASSMEVAGDGRGCPTPEAIWSSARRETAARDEDRLLMHVGECPACAALWRMARDLTADSLHRTVHVRPRPFRWRPWLPVAAAVAAGFVLIAVGLLLWTGPDDTAPVYRARGAEWLQPQISEEEVLPRDRCLLRWTPGPEGTTYQLRVTDERLDVLARGRGLEDAAFLVPEEALRDLAPHSRIVWQVTARLPDGTTVDSTSFISRIE